MNLVRRLDDAFCAFWSGHSRRDYDRVRRRRAELLGRRMLGRLEILLADDEGGLRELAYGSRARSLKSELDRLAQLLNRASASRIAQLLDFDRASLTSRRRGELLDRYAVDQTAEIPDDAWSVFWVAPNQHYGKLYEGLAEEGFRDHALCKLGLCRRYGHEFFSLLKRFLRDIRGPP